MRAFTIIFILASSFLFSQSRHELQTDERTMVNFLTIALSQTGKTEETNNNDGEHIEEYLKAVGLNPKGRYPYCAAGVYWAFSNAAKITGQPCPIPKTASANAIYDYAVKNGKRSKNYLAEAGDLLVWKLKNSYNGHIEIVLINKGGGVLKTMGFNTGPGNQREGQGNYIKYRSQFNPIGKLLVRGIVGFKY